MNAESNELLRQMERATSAAPVDPDSLDDETAMLRENWVALGKLIKAAETELPTVQVTELRLAAEDQFAFKKQTANRFGWICLAAALSLAGIWCGIRLADLPQSEGIQQEAKDLADRPESLRDSNSSPSPVGSNSMMTQLAWDDGLDNQFAQTISALRDFHDGSGLRDSALSRLEGEFRAVARDFESGSL